MRNTACYFKFPFNLGLGRGCWPCLLSAPDCVPCPSASGMWSWSPVITLKGLKALLCVEIRKWPHPQVALCLSHARGERGQSVWLQSP